MKEASQYAVICPSCGATVPVKYMHGDKCMVECEEMPGYRSGGWEWEDDADYEDYVHPDAENLRVRDKYDVLDGD